MPRMPQMPSSDLDWNQLLAANATRRGAAPNNARPPSRLSTSMRADSSPGVPRLASVSSRPAALPYPVNEGPMTPEVYMPIEQDHQWLPPARPGQPIVPEYHSDTYAPASAVVAGGPNRPPPPARHSFTSTSPTEPRAPGSRPELVSRASHANVIGPTKQEAEAMLKRGLPDCSRPDPIANRDDWYTMVGAPALNFCPKCIEAIFERTVYRKYFRRALPCDLNTKIACAFGSPWIRLAYLLTVQQRLADLQLFRDLADIDANSDPCPKGQEAVRVWYGLKDNEGLFVRDFQVCYTDVRKLERLLPTFSGFFQKLPGRSSWEKKRCSLRAATNRFTQYLNTIIEMHDQAHTLRTLPNPMPFVLLVERKLSLRECERDSLILGGLWHYIPAVPAFTVCEECYEEVIEPEVRKGVDIAKRFNQTIQPAYGESIGTSCQLYSARMRRVFARSIKDNDLKYLARKAKERREAELRLQDKQTGLIQRLERVESLARGGGVDDEESRRRLTRELRHITLEWKEDWE
ncbi:hypothetical protein AMS68_003298 [Peltaster fructicola]|uniref:Uncharacterized protein n=1 Tax=Peltaster fructicola TaxID=286661 RepID=A0A6H0XSY9_9PEZI|nr:hypothetical protein AMS68_003298 [Peltaster fructicola]